VTIIENLGATSLLSLELSGSDVALQVMVPEGSEPAIGSEVTAQYDHDRTLLYDGDTGDLIGSDRLVKAS
jgi:multiple sugar transport system ATP-binding protein